MLYDRTSEFLYYGKNQHLTGEEAYDYEARHGEFVKDVLNTDYKEMQKKIYGIEQEEPEGISKVISWIIGGCCLIGFVALVVCLVLKQLVLFGYIFAGLFLIAGVSTLLSNRAVDHESKSTSQRYKMKIWAVLFILLSVVTLLLIIFRNRFAGAEFMVYLISAGFTLSGIMIIILPVASKIMNRKNYTLEVPATCTGYVRRLEYEGSDRSGAIGHARRFTFFYTSPVFEYTVNGKQYEGVYDIFANGKDSDVPLGQTTIKVDPRDPQNIENPKELRMKNVIPMFIIGGIALCAGIGLGIYGLMGYAKDMTVETQWNPMLGTEETTSEPKLPAITDEIVEQNYGSAINGAEWYVEKTTVKTVSKYEDKVIVAFADDSFKNVLFEPEKAPVKGDVLYLFYTLVEDHESMDKGYKQIITYFLEGEGEYTGTHGAFVR